MSANDSVNDSTLEMDRLTILEKQLGELSTRLTGFILNNNILRKRVRDLTEFKNKMFDEFFELESYISDLDQQYTRRNNVEFRNIPESLGNKDIEKYVIEVLGYIGVEVESYDIVAVHRLGRHIINKNRSVIVRFLNRKNAYSCLNNSKKLSESSNAGYKKIFITENLCPTYKKLFNYLYKLKKEAKISSVWTFNGNVFFKISADTNERPIKIQHIDEVEDYLVVSYY